MGIVINQSIRNIFITCLGFGIGAINTLFLFTNFLKEEYYGLVSYLLSVSNLLWPFIAFGVHNTIIKFYSAYTNKEEQDRFMSTMLLFPIFIAIVTGGLGYVFYDKILHYFEGENAIVQPYVWSIFVLALVNAYFEVFFSWAKVKLQSVFGNVLKELFIRVCTMILLFLVYFHVITVVQFIYALIGIHFLRMLIMKLYALRLHSVRFVLSVPHNIASVLKYSFLILIAGSVAALLIDLDKAMIENYLPIENVAKYSICAYIASVIIIPSRAMHQILYPLTAQVMNDKDHHQLEVLYKKSSLNLVLISGLLFVLILCNVKELFECIPDQYELYIWVVVLVGLSKLSDNLAGNNNAILYSSDYYRMVLFFGVVMALIAFVLNLICIPVYGVTGAAIATFGAVLFYNIAKLFLVLNKFRMHPFSKGTLQSLLLIVGFSFSFYFWDFSFHPLVNIIFKSILIGVGYLIILFVFNISKDITDFVKKVL